jgi:hypothetical protein
MPYETWRENGACHIGSALSLFRKCKDGLLVMPHDHHWLCTFVIRRLVFMAYVCLDLCTALYFVGLVSLVI